MTDITMTDVNRLMNMIVKDEVISRQQFLVLMNKIICPMDCLGWCLLNPLWSVGLFQIWLYDYFHFFQNDVLLYDELCEGMNEVLDPRLVSLAIYIEPFEVPVFKDNMSTIKRYACLFDLVMSDVGLKDRFYKGTVYNACAVSSDIVDFFVENQDAANREDAIKIGQYFMRQGWLVHVLGHHHFKDEYLFFNVTRYGMKVLDGQKLKKRKSSKFTEIVFMFLRMVRGIDICNRKWRLQKYKNCFVGEDAVKWMITHKVANSRSEAEKNGQLMLNFGLISHYVCEHPFKDKSYYYIITPSGYDILQNKQNLLDIHRNKSIVEIFKGKMLEANFKILEQDIIIIDTSSLIETFNYMEYLISEMIRPNSLFDADMISNFHIFGKHVQNWLQHQFLTIEDEPEKVLFDTAVELLDSNNLYFFELIKKVLKEPLKNMDYGDGYSWRSLKMMYEKHVSDIPQSNLGTALLVINTMINKKFVVDNTINVELVSDFYSAIVFKKPKITSSLAILQIVYKIVYFSEGYNQKDFSFSTSKSSRTDL